MKKRVVLVVTILLALLFIVAAYWFFSSRSSDIDGTYQLEIDNEQIEKDGDLLSEQAIDRVVNEGSNIEDVPDQDLVGAMVLLVSENRCEEALSFAENIQSAESSKEELVIESYKTQLACYKRASAKEDYAKKREEFKELLLSSDSAKSKNLLKSFDKVFLYEEIKREDEDRI